MFGLNSKDALGLAEDVVLINNIADGAAAAAGAKRSSERADLLDQASRRMREQYNTILTLRAQLAAAIQRAERAEAALDALEDKNADHVAVANATAITLKEAVRELQQKTDEPQLKEEQYLRNVRTKNYHAQVNQLLEQGLLKKDPRITDAVKRRAWYVPGLDPDHGL